MAGTPCTGNFNRSKRNEEALAGANQQKPLAAKMPSAAQPQSKIHKETRKPRVFKNKNPGFLVSLCLFAATKTVKPL
jgi:hypothetical protein